METRKTLERFIALVTIAHHIPGRIRLKFDISAFDGHGLREIHPDHLRVALENLRGVFSVRLNALARSCTVEYNERVIPRTAWEDLLACRMTPAAETLIDVLREKYEEVTRA